jgi:hypothetical protein
LTWRARRRRRRNKTCCHHVKWLEVSLLFIFVFAKFCSYSFGVTENFEGNAKAGPLRTKSVKLLGKLREVESEEDKQVIDEGKRIELLRLVGKVGMMNREILWVQEVINKLWEELGM